MAESTLPVGSVPDRSAFFHGQSVAITGAAGSVGGQLVKRLLTLGAARILALDNNENSLFHLANTFATDSRVVTRFCDISHAGSMRGVFSGIDLLFHSAALKHVGICETAPLGAINVNLNGLENVLKEAIDSRVRQVVFTSSDKAVNPTNVMGTTKLLGERLASFMNSQSDRTRISCTRFGNVAGSSGSVIPLFISQVQSGERVTLTSNEMTRFFMSLSDAVELILDSMVHARGGEIFVTRMSVIRIADLARVIIDRVAPQAGLDALRSEISVVGVRPGEKLFEELTTEEEQPRTVEYDRYLVVHPVGFNPQSTLSAYSSLGAARLPIRPYNSKLEPAIGKSEIVEFLTKNSLLPTSISEPVSAELVSETAQ